MKFTLYWKNGKKDEIFGNDLPDALLKHQLTYRPNHIACNLDFYTIGDDAQPYNWHAKCKCWFKPGTLMDDIN